MLENENTPPVENESAQNGKQQTSVTGVEQEDIEKIEENEQTEEQLTKPAEVQRDDVEQVEVNENEKRQFELTEAQEDQTENIEEVEQHTEDHEKLVPIKDTMTGEKDHSDEQSITDENLTYNLKSDVDLIMNKEDEKHVSNRVLSKKSSEDLDILPKISKSEVVAYEELEEGLKPESESESTIYLESTYDERSQICTSIRSTIPPKSLPSDAQLSQDTDVYPETSEYIVTTESDLVLKAAKTGKDLIRELSIMQIESVTAIKNTLETINSSPPPISKVPSAQIQGEHVLERVVETESFEEAELEAEMSLKGFSFLHNDLVFPLGRDRLEEISFSETLLISYDLYGDEQKGEACQCEPLGVPHKSLLFEPRDVQEMGGMCLSIETAACKIITFCTTQFSCMGTAGASRLLSVVNNGFALVEEKKTEWHCTHDKKIVTLKKSNNPN